MAENGTAADFLRTKEVVYATTPKPSAGMLAAGVALLLLGGPALTGAGLAQAAWDGYGTNPTKVLLVVGLALVVVGVGMLAMGVYRVAQTIDRIGGVGFVAGGTWTARSTRAVALSTPAEQAAAPDVA